MDSKLIDKGWLKRRINLANHNEVIEYSGRGLGTEKVSAGENEFVTQSEFCWFAPEFNFDLDGKSYSVKVRVWPWVSLRSLEVYVNARLEYSEGGKPYKVSRLTEAVQMASFFALIFIPLIIASKLV